MNKASRPMVNAGRQRGILIALRHFCTSHSGAGAIEFALVAPVLILLYVGSAEVSVALSINKKVARAASTVADLVTQQSCVDTDFLNSMVDVSNAIMAPYNESPIKLKVSEISIDGDGAATIDWSWDQDDHRPYAAGDTATIPTDLVIRDTSLVRAELSFDHALFLPGAASLSIRNLTMEKTYYLRPRGDGPVQNKSDCAGG